jgi:hypothetical protein
MTDPNAGNFVVNQKPQVPVDRKIELKGTQNTIKFTLK